MKKFLFEGKRKLIGIPVAIFLIIAFWPFLLGAVLIYFAVKKIHLKGLKYTVISIFLFFSLIFGSAWVAAIKSPTPSVENTKADVTEVKTVAATSTPTQQPKSTPTNTPTPSAIPTKIPTPTPTIYIAPTIAPTAVPTAVPATQAQTSGGYSCDCSKTCTEISSCAEAQYQLNVCGCTQRDADHDGIACDSAPLHCQN